VEVESTTRSAKERVAGFEGREGHRTPFAPKPEYHHSKELIGYGMPAAFPRLARCQYRKIAAITLIV
jgi:hypothetical protein